MSSSAACSLSVIQEILDRTGYSLDVTTGQRKYGGPPPGLPSNPPGSGHEVLHSATDFHLAVICVVSQLFG